VTILAAPDNGPIEGFSHTNETPTALAATEAGRSQFSVTLDQPSSNWFFFVAAASPGLKVLGVAAPYTISVACSGLTSCKAGPQTNTVKRYTNLENAPFEPIQDTSTFATCP
jgi:hypothetical protein